MPRKDKNPPHVVPGPVQANFDINGVKFYLMRRGPMSEDLADDLMHWANRVFTIETSRKWSAYYPYRVADSIIEILNDDRFIIFDCEICGERSIMSELTEDERELFPRPNEPNVEELTISNEQICADCQAAREL